MAAEFITITVVTTGNDLEDERFNVNEPIKVVFNRALALVGGSSNREQFTLEFNDQALDLERRIRDLAAQFGWGEKVVLDLVPRPEVI